MSRLGTPTAATGFHTFLLTRRARVDAALATVLPTPPGAPALIDEAMRYSLLVGGKRLRPLLALAAAEAVGLGDETEQDRLVLPAACAVEMIHTYSLIHDDLPAMDDDTMRRGQPTSHVVYGEGIAVLAGDGLLSEAFGLLVRLPETNDPQLMTRKLRTAERIAGAAGVTGMVGGQVVDLHAAGQVPADLSGGSHAAPAREPLDEAGLRAMHARKTGALIRAAAVSGAIMAGGDDPAVEAVDRYAAAVGLAFQIVDDILDVEGAAERLGKTAGKDAAAGKPTYPALHGLDESRRLAAASVSDAKRALTDAGLGGPLHAIADWVVSRTN